MEFNVYDVGLLPLIIGLVAVATSLGLPKKLAPVLALILGVLSGVVYLAPDNAAQGVLVGIALGLASVGLYSGAKNTVEKSTE
jgi:L-cystine uptake protein TcyP (sodium:dicarboxylate symporter family)